MHSVVPLEKSIEGSYLGPKADYAKMFAFAAEHVSFSPVSLRSCAAARQLCLRLRLRLRLGLRLDSGSRLRAPLPPCAVD